MTFGEKLKKLRNDNGMTQDQLAEKIFVTRTAISKWETNNGYPSIDSLKEISILFGISIDDLISDVDVENKKVLDKKIARRFYYIAVAFLGITVLFAMLAYCLNQPLFNIGSILGMVGFIAFGLLQRPKYKLIKNVKKTDTRLNIKNKENYKFKREITATLLFQKAGKGKLYRLSEI